MKENRSLRWIIWFLAAFFYFYEYLLRVAPNVMVPELMQAFKLNATELGVLTAAFLLIYAPMQLPVGILMDRYGARNLLTFASLGCGIGAILFGAAQDLQIAYIGRILIGVSSSFAFVGMVYICSHWFEKNKRASLVGLANSISMLGASAGVGPLSVMVDKMGWRATQYFWGVVGIVLAVVIILLVKKDAPPPTDLTDDKETPHSLLEGIKIFCKSFQSWNNAIIALLFYNITTAIGGLWGVPFIQAAYGVSKEVAGYAISMIFFGWMVGSPITGFISDRLNNRKHVLLISLIATLICFTPIIYYTSMPIYWVYVLIFLTGFFSSAELLNFTFATEITPARVKGTSIAMANFVVSLGGAIIQPLIGYLLEKAQTPTLAGATEIYTKQNYAFALSTLPACLIVAIVLCFFLKEKHRNEQAY